MTVSELNKFFDNFLEPDPNNKLYSILVDGKSGIGKTTTIMEYFKDKDNYIYISFFGIEKMDEIISVLSDKIDSSYILNNNSNLVLANNYTDEWNNGVIIFDDLERKTANIKLHNIEGLINSLVRNGFKVISIINSSFVVEKNLEEREELLSFYEKTFDRKLNVDVSEDIVKKLLDIYDSSVINSYLILANSNMRILLRAKKFFDSIDEYFRNNGKTNYLNDIGLDYKKYFRCILIAIRCIFSNDLSEKQFGKDDFFWKSKYESYCKQFKHEKNIANELYNIFNSKDNDLIENAHLSEPFVIGLIRTYLSDDLKSLDNEYYKILDDNDILGKSPFNNHIFYLGDSDNQKYKDAFINNINKFDFSNERHVTLLMDIANYAVIPFSKSELDKIIDRINKTVKVDKFDILYNQLDDFLIMHNEPGKKQVKIVIDEIKSRLKNKIEQNEFEMLNREIEKKNYTFLIDYLYEKRTTDITHKKDIENILEKVDYLLPDLSKSINYSIWSYCHEIARFLVGDEEHIEKFIKVLVKQYNLNPNSNSLKIKCSGLVRQYYGRNFDSYLNK